MKVLVTGDSHTAMLKRGKDSLTNKGEWPATIDLTVKGFGNGRFLVLLFFLDKGDYAEITIPEYRKRFTRFPPAESNAIYGLSALLHPHAIRNHKSWLEFAPAQLVIHETPVSDAVLKRFIQDRTQYVLELIDIMLRTQNKFFVIEAPWPFKSTDASKSIRPEVLTYVDRYYRNFVKHELEIRKVPVVSVSSECCDESGFMRDCYRATDEEHANFIFGELIMKKILNFLLTEENLHESK